MYFNRRSVGSRRPNDSIDIIPPFERLAPVITTATDRSGEFLYLFPSKAPLHTVQSTFARRRYMLRDEISGQVQ